MNAIIRRTVEEKMNDIIRRAVEEYPNVKLTFKRYIGGISMFLDGKMIYIKSTDDWERVKQKIESRLNPDNKQCGVCCETAPINVCCAECANRICICCHITIHITNNGGYNCPYCRKSSNEPDDVIKHVEYCMRMIANNTDNSSYYDYVKDKIMKSHDFLV